MDSTLASLSLTGDQKRKVDALDQDYQDKQWQMRDGLLLQFKGTLDPQQFAEVEVALRKKPGQPPGAPRGAAFATLPQPKEPRPPNQHEHRILANLHERYAIDRVATITFGGHGRTPGRLCSRRCPLPVSGFSPFLLVGTWGGLQPPEGLAALLWPLKKGLQKPHSSASLAALLQKAAPALSRSQNTDVQGISQWAEPTFT